MQSGGVFACTQHPRSAISSRQHSIEPVLIHGAVMRTCAGIAKCTPPGCISVLGPSLAQSVPRPRAERVTGREHALPAVDKKMCMHVAKHAQANATPQCNQFKPLFSVGSVILARMSHHLKGLMLSRNPMHIEEALGHYDYILSDGNRWLARCLIQVRRPSMETGTQRAADQ